MKALAVFFLVAFCLMICRGADQQLEKALNDRYDGKAIHLRHFFKSDSQEYDAQGTPLKSSAEGAWTLYGGIEVKKVSVGDDALRVEGTRVAYVYDEREKRLAETHTRDEVRIKIRLNAALPTADQAVSVLERVFAITADVIVNSSPAPWQDYLKKQLGLPGADLPWPPTSAELASPTFLKVGEAGVTAPKPLSAREPVFTDIARHNHVQGVVGLSVVVGPEGTVHQVRIVKPMGMGLDENAIEAVKTWRFQPGTKDGVPVAIWVYIEVDFHLYNQR
jgi:TonB family protein